MCEEIADMIDWVSLCMYLHANIQAVVIEWTPFIIHVVLLVLNISPWGPWVLQYWMVSKSEIHTDVRRVNSTLDMHASVGCESDIIT
jgi:hypothetical protein